MEHILHKEYIKNEMSKEEFIKLYEEWNSSRKLARALKGRVTRGFLESYYKDCKHIAYQTTRVCSSCKKEFNHIVKSRRDSTKLCSKCKVQKFKEIRKRTIEGRPSHRRLKNTSDTALKGVEAKLKGTYFKKVEASEKSERHVKLTCICGNYVELLIKEAKRGPKSRKNSCGCKRKCGISQKEIELREFLEQYGNLKLNKKPPFMKGLELDIFIPEKSLAIEYHGLAFHSERPVFRDKDIKTIKKVHELKYKLCKAAGINLIQIFEDEWRDKKEIVKSMLKSRLNISDKRVFARKCQIKKVNRKIKKEFFNRTHIAGDVPSKITLGLYYEGELVSAISLRGTWNKAHGESVIEIARFSSELNTQVVGGFSKLLKYVNQWALEEGYDTILTYADCRFGQGKVYEKNGFMFKNKTNPNYFYEKSGVREDRFKHRKVKELPGLTEREQQNKLGWYAIYDAGSNIFVKAIA